MSVLLFLIPVILRIVICTFADDLYPMDLLLLLQCITEGLGLVFQQQDPLSSSSLQNDEVYVQVRI